MTNDMPVFGRPNCFWGWSCILTQLRFSLASCSWWLKAMCFNSTSHALRCRDDFSSIKPIVVSMRSCQEHRPLQNNQTDSSNWLLDAVALATSKVDLTLSDLWRLAHCECASCLLRAYWSELRHSIHKRLGNDASLCNSIFQWLVL